MPFSFCFTPATSSTLLLHDYSLWTCQKTQVNFPNQRISDLAGLRVLLAHYVTWHSSCWQAALVTHKWGSTSSQTLRPRPLWKAAETLQLTREKITGSERKAVCRPPRGPLRMWSAQNTQMSILCNNKVLEIQVALSFHVIWTFHTINDKIF